MGVYTGPTYRISYSGNNVVVNNYCGHTATFNGIHKSRMYVKKSTAWDAVGLCGNCNDNRTDQMMMRNGTYLHDTGSDKKDMYKLVGDSWLVPDQWFDRYEE